MFKFLIKAFFLILD